MSSERLDRVEENSAHQDAAIEDLSQEVRRQGMEIDLLRREIGKLTRTLEVMIEEGEEEGPADQKPPHY